MLGENFLQIFHTFDLDQDGKLSREEFIQGKKHIVHRSDESIAECQGAKSDLSIVQQLQGDPSASTTTQPSHSSENSSSSSITRLRT